MIFQKKYRMPLQRMVGLLIIIAVLVVSFAACSSDSKIANSDNSIKTNNAGDNSFILNKEKNDANNGIIQITTTKKTTKKATSKTTNRNTRKTTKKATKKTTKKATKKNKTKKTANKTKTKTKSKTKTKTKTETKTRTEYKTGPTPTRQETEAPTQAPTQPTQAPTQPTQAPTQPTQAPKTFVDENGNEWVELDPNYTLEDFPPISKQN